jgi:signal transduction histidine kinase
VLGMTELLLDTPLEPRQRQFARTIQSSATALLDILNDILDLSKIEAGKLDIERIEMDPRQILEEVGIAVAPQAAVKHLELIVSVRPGVPDRVMGDPHRLRQVLLNLCTNAVKFTERAKFSSRSFRLPCTKGACSSVSKCRTPESESSRKRRHGFSSRSRRRTARQLAATGAPAWACRSCGSWFH